MQSYKLRLRTEQEAYEHRLEVDGFRDGEKYATNASYSNLKTVCEVGMLWMDMQECGHSFVNMMMDRAPSWTEGNRAEVWAWHWEPEYVFNFIFGALEILENLETATDVSSLEIGDE